MRTLNFDNSNCNRYRKNFLLIFYCFQSKMKIIWNKSRASDSTSLYIVSCERELNSNTGSSDRSPCEVTIIRKEFPLRLIKKLLLILRFLFVIVQDTAGRTLRGRKFRYLARVQEWSRNWHREWFGHGHRVGYLWTFLVAPDQFSWVI